MQFVRKSFFGPKNLSNRKKKYFSLLKEKGLIESVHIKKVSNTKAIYDFYQEQRELATEMVKIANKALKI